jgi:hypothetical protein
MNEIDNGMTNGIRMVGTMMRLEYLYGNPWSGGLRS